VSLDLEDALPRLRAAWMAGRSAVDQAPAAWRETLGDGPAAEAALAALAGHALQAVFRPTAPGRLTPRPLLPRLAAPTPSAAARSRIRRLLAGKADEARIRGIVQLAAARGYVLHPADWTPDARDDWAPAVYAPWLAWAASERAEAPAGTLTADNYEDWPWAERRAALAALRRNNQAAAGAIVAARAGREPAERRLKLVELLEDGLSATDIPFLESLAGDRSDRVRAEARRLLARLGHGASDAELAAELAGLVEIARVGLIRRRTQLKLVKLKTTAQEKRRTELFQLVTLRDLAGALGADETALLDQPPQGEPQAVLGFVTQVAETGSDAARRILLERLLESDSLRLDWLAPLARRMTTAERARELPAVIARESAVSFQETLAFAGDALGCAPLRALIQAQGYRQLGAALKLAVSGEGQARSGAEAQLRIALANLGQLADASAARALIQTCSEAGLSPADPALDLLHLNAALERPS
jgi:hypothetical protein